jgi:hypothetical protein
MNKVRFCLLGLLIGLIEVGANLWDLFTPWRMTPCFQTHQTWFRRLGLWAIARQMDMIFGRPKCPTPNNAA